MTELPQLEAKLSFGGNELVFGVRHFVDFNVIVKNIGYEPASKIKILLSLPYNVKAPIKSKSIGYLAPSKERAISFKIRAIYPGIYDIMVIIKRKENILFNLPFKFRAGTPVPVERQPIPTAVSIKRPSTIKCPYCGNDTKENSKFCQNCGHSLVSKFCPNCGSPLEVDAKFCGECGANTDKI